MSLSTSESERYTNSRFLDGSPRIRDLHMIRCPAGRSLRSGNTGSSELFDLRRVRDVGGLSVLLPTVSFHQFCRAFIGSQLAILAGGLLRLAVLRNANGPATFLVPCVQLAITRTALEDGLRRLANG